MRLSIVIPAYNEERRLPQTLGALRAYFTDIATFELHEVIVVDDGSSDATSKVVEEWKGRLPMKLVQLPVNRGKGAATKMGVLAASGEYVLLYDADGATPIDELKQFAAALHEHHPQVILGSRVVGGRGQLVSMRWYRRLMGRVYHALCAPLVLGIHDTACGCKLFSADAAKKIFSLQRIDRFAFDVEIVSLALKLGYKVREIPVRWNAIPGSQVRIVRDTFQMAWCVIKLHVHRITGS